MFFCQYSVGYLFIMDVSVGLFLVCVKFCLCILKENIRYFLRGNVAKRFINAF